MSKTIRRILSLLLCFCLIFEQAGFAQSIGQLDISGYLASLRNSFIQDKFRPLHLRYLQFNSQEDDFRLLVDKGDTKDLADSEIEESTKELMRYFFVGLTLSNESFWVNLRPDSPDNIIDDQLAQTDVGRILLEADLQLKKDTAKYTSPETPEGREYWDKLYQKSGELFGSENITIPTLTRPWIVPDEIIIREADDSAYIYKATLKVMLEEDYLNENRRGGFETRPYTFTDPRLKELNVYSSQLIRELIIPKITKEINTSKRYAPLRQVYYSLVLAQWFKQRFPDRGGYYNQIIDRKDLTGLTSKEPYSKETYFMAYQKSFKDGEYNIKEPRYTPYGQTIRSYFSGGITATVLKSTRVVPAVEPIPDQRPYLRRADCNGPLDKPVVRMTGNPLLSLFAPPNSKALRTNEDKIKKGKEKRDTPSTTAKRPKLRPIKKLWWDDEVEVLGHFRALLAELGWPLPRVIPVDGKISNEIIPKPLNIASLKRLAQGKSPSEYMDYLSIGDNLPEAYGSIVAPFLNEFGILRLWSIWFRYAKQLNSIIDYVDTLPNKRPVRILVHAVWQGEDAYAIAIALNHFYPDRKFEIIGVDFIEPKPEELNWIYTKNIPDYLQANIDTYFDYQTEKVVSLKDKYRNMVTLKQGDIRDRGSFPNGIDVVVANGVLGQSITDDDYIWRSIENAWFALSPGGIFCTDNSAYRAYPDQKEKVDKIIAQDFIRRGKFRPIADSLFMKPAAQPPAAPDAQNGGGQSSNPGPPTTGGIDFRILPAVTQAISNLGLGNIPLARMDNINLDNEWSEIEQLVNARITPSPDRIKEYVQVSCYQRRIAQDKQKVISCISDTLRQQEQSCDAADPVLLDILLLLEMSNSAKYLRTFLAGPEGTEN